MSYSILWGDETIKYDENLDYDSLEWTPIDLTQNQQIPLTINKAHKYQLATLYSPKDNSKNLPPYSLYFFLRYRSKVLNLESEEYNIETSYEYEYINDNKFVHIADKTVPIVCDYSYINYDRNYSFNNNITFPTTGDPFVINAEFIDKGFYNASLFMYNKCVKQSELVIPSEDDINNFLEITGTTYELSESNDIFGVKYTIQMPANYASKKVAGFNDNLFMFHYWFSPLDHMGNENFGGLFKLYPDDIGAGTLYTELNFNDKKYFTIYDNDPPSINITLTNNINGESIFISVEENVNDDQISENIYAPVSVSTDTDLFETHEDPVLNPLEPNEHVPEITMNNTIDIGLVEGNRFFVNIETIDNVDDSYLGYGELNIFGEKVTFNDSNYSNSFIARSSTSSTITVTVWDKKGFDNISNARKITIPVVVNKTFMRSKSLH